MTHPHLDPKLEHAQEANSAAFEAFKSSVRHMNSLNTGLNNAQKEVLRTSQRYQDSLVALLKAKDEVTAKVVLDSREQGGGGGGTGV